MERRRVKLQGLNIDTFSFESALSYGKSVSGQVITINPEMISYGVENPEFAQIVEDAVLVIPDGIGVEIGLKILGNNVRRIAGIEFARKMIDLVSKDDDSIALVGARQNVIEKAVENLKKEVPNLNVVYAQNGYFIDDKIVYEKLAEKQPRLLLVAMGSPRQEEFINKVKSILPNTLMIGVGGSFDVWAGEVQRAPEIYQKMGLEWLYRTVKEPQRFNRIFPVLPLFVLNVLKEKLFGRV